MCAEITNGGGGARARTHTEQQQAVSPLRYHVCFCCSLLWHSKSQRLALLFIILEWHKHGLLTKVHIFFKFTKCLFYPFPRHSRRQGTLRPKQAFRTMESRGWGKDKELVLRIRICNTHTHTHTYIKYIFAQNRVNWCYITSATESVFHIKQQ
jgi:hypothetical protein